VSYRGWRNRARGARVNRLRARAHDRRCTGHHGPDAVCKYPVRCGAEIGSYEPTLTKSCAGSECAQGAVLEVVLPRRHERYLCIVFGLEHIMSKFIKEILSKPSLTDWLQAIFGIPAFLIAIWALNDASKATEDASSAVVLADEANLEMAINTVPAAQSDLIILQMASYRIENCPIAQREIDTYGLEFGRKPTLWKSPSGAFAVVGIEAASMADAEGLKERAQALSQDDRFRNEDLENARIRINPDWTMVSSCSAL